MLEENRMRIWRDRESNYANPTSKFFSKAKVENGLEVYSS
jgi:hypothetical protein